MTSFVLSSTHPSLTQTILSVSYLLTQTVLPQTDLLPCQQLWEGGDKNLWQQSWHLLSWYSSSMHCLTTFSVCSTRVQIKEKNNTFPPPSSPDPISLWGQCFLTMTKNYFKDGTDEDRLVVTFSQVVSVRQGHPSHSSWYFTTMSSACHWKKLIVHS